MSRIEAHEEDWSRLWRRLRNSKLRYRFVRKTPIFQTRTLYCRKLRIVVTILPLEEIAPFVERCTSEGFLVKAFTPTEVKHHLDDVVRSIYESVKARSEELGVKPGPRGLRRCPGDTQSGLPCARDVPCPIHAT